MFENAPFISMAEMMRKFESSTSQISMPHMNCSMSHDGMAGSVQRKAKLTLTRPKEPELGTAQCYCPIKLMSSAQLIIYYSNSIFLFLFVLIFINFFLFILSPLFSSQFSSSLSHLHYSFLSFFSSFSFMFSILSHSPTLIPIPSRFFFVDISLSLSLSQEVTPDGEAIWDLVTSSQLFMVLFLL